MNQSDPNSAGRPGEYGGNVFPNVFHLLNIQGFWQTIDAVPTEKPRTFFEQVRIVTAGGSSRLYIYDTGGLAWRYTALT